MPCAEKIFARFDLFTLLRLAFSTGAPRWSAAGSQRPAAAAFERPEREDISHVWIDSHCCDWLSAQARPDGARLCLRDQPQQRLNVPSVRRIRPFGLIHIAATGF